MRTGKVPAVWRGCSVHVTVEDLGRNIVFGATGLPTVTRQTRNVLRVTTSSIAVARAAATRRR